ncbi:hypothetical protein TNCV_1072311 [Trichonephila clavipes]|nr:hypothetical protein TNCV_1072311 [Trichonephila clavipes]
MSNEMDKKKSFSQSEAPPIDKLLTNFETVIMNSLVSKQIVQILGPWISPIYSCLPFVWKTPGTHCLSSNVREIDHYKNNSGGFTVWAGIPWDGFHTALSLQDTL